MIISAPLILLQSINTCMVCSASACIKAQSKVKVLKSSFCAARFLGLRVQYPFYASVMPRSLAEMVTWVTNMSLLAYSAAACYIG